MVNKVNPRLSVLFILQLFLIISVSVNSVYASELSESGLHLIPYPNKLTTGGHDFTFVNELTVILDKEHSVSDRFTADELIRDLKSEWNINARIGQYGTYPSIVLTRRQAPKSLTDQGYQLTTGEGELIIRANGEEGLFYTLLTDTGSPG